MSGIIDRWMRLRTRIFGRGIDRAVDEEFEFHMEMRARDYEAQGMDPVSARRAARRRFGDVTGIRHEALGPERRRVGIERLRMLTDELREDLRFGIRQILRSPGFAAVIALILALGIGANVAIFSVIKGILIRPLPYPDPGRVVAVWETHPDRRGHRPFSALDFFDMREQNSSFVEMGAMIFPWANVSIDGTSVRLRSAAVSSGVLEVLGIQPAIGRLFAEGEDGEGTARAAILSDATWHELFSADPGVVGREVIIDGRICQIVGVMPPEFEFVRPWSLNRTPALYIPLDYTGNMTRSGHWLGVIGRLKEGVSVRQAEADLRNIASRLMEEYPTTNGQVQVWIEPFLFRNLPSVMLVLIGLMVVVGMLLLIACANVASMLLARGTSRVTELAVRASLGAGGPRLARQLITESLLLSLGGGVIGMAVAWWGVGVLSGMMPPEIPRTEGITVDGGVLTFAVAITLLTGVAFGLVPALFAARRDVGNAIRSASAGQSATRSSNRTLSFLVVVQLAMAFGLANAAVAMLLSLANVRNLPQYFDTDQVLTSRISIRGERYRAPGAGYRFWDVLLERVRAIPGVESAGATTKLPLLGGNNSSVLVEGEAYDPLEQRPLVERTWCTPGYLESMGVDLIRGRRLEERDMDVQRPPDGNPMLFNIVVNQTFVDRYYPEVDPIGQTVRHNTEPPSWTGTIVGVVEDVRQWGLTYLPLREIYFPLSAYVYSDSYLVVRSADRPSALLPSLSTTLAGIDPTLPLADVQTMADLVEEQNRGRRFHTLLVVLFTLTALLLALAGTYGVMSYYVNRRRHEIGIRVALGAARSEVIGIFLRQSGRLLGIGLLTGIGLTSFVMALVGHMIFGVGPVDLRVAGLTVLLMVLEVGAATLIPALRATRVDPVDTLRVE